MREGGKCWVGKHRDVTAELVDHVWLGSVERLAMVANVLRAVEDLEGEAVEKVTRGHQSSHRAQRESSLAVQVGAELGELRDGTARKDSLPLEVVHDVVV